MRTMGTKLLENPWGDIALSINLFSVETFRKLRS
jgi:hypothetical protein